MLSINLVFVGVQVCCIDKPPEQDYNISIYLTHVKKKSVSAHLEAKS